MQIRVKNRHDETHVLKMNCHWMNGKIFDVYDVDVAEHGLYKSEKRYWLVPFEDMPCAFVAEGDCEVIG